MSGAEPILAAEAIGTAAAGAAAAEAAVAAEALAAAEAAAAAQAAATAMEATSAAASAGNVANPFFDPSQYANQFSKGLLQSSSGLPPAGPFELTGSVAPSAFRPEMLGKGASGLTMMQGLQAARMASSLGPKQQTAVGPPMRRGQQVNLMQPASLLEQKRKRNPIISLL